MKFKKKMVISSLAVALSFSIAIPSFAATEHWNDNSSKQNISTDWLNWKASWENVKNDFEQISLTPGETEKELNFAWYSKKINQSKIRVSNTKDMSNPAELLGTSNEYKQINGVTYYANKVTATGLKSNTLYYYQYYLDGAWTETEKFETQDAEKFSFLYVGDPQIGASIGQTASDSKDAQTAEYAARNDAFSWNTTLETAINANPDLSFIVSAGDQINETAKDGSAAKDLQQEIEYSGFLSPEVLSSLPVATTIGNHDALTANYGNHFNNPNPFKEETTPTKAGNGYYYTYGDALFIMLNTNNYNCADHEALLKKATEENSDAKWRIVTFHQDIYGSGADHSDSDGIILRTQLTTLLDKYDVDVVLQGHDHTYSRSYQLTSDGEEHTSYDAAVNLSDEATHTEFLNQNLCYQIVSDTKDAADNVVTDPEGVLYMEANSSSGSKYYNLITAQQNFIVSRSQTWTPSYSVIDVTKDSLTINTYDVATGEKIDKPYTIKKTTAVPAAKVTLNKTKLELAVGKTFNLNPTVTPANTTDTVVFTSSNTKIATVNDKTGVVTAKKAGACTITVTCGTKTAVCKITVK